MSSSLIEEQASFLTRICALAASSIRKVDRLSEPDKVLQMKSLTFGRELFKNSVSVFGSVSLNRIVSVN